MEVCGVPENRKTGGILAASTGAAASMMFDPLADATRLHRMPGGFAGVPVYGKTNGGDLPSPFLKVREGKC